MLISTTSSLDGYNIEYIWFISSEVIIWANFVKDIFASVTDFFGGRSDSYEKSLIVAKNNAMEELISKAKAAWADAVIWVDIDFDAIGSKWSMFMVNISWTAVKISKK